MDQDEKTNDAIPVVAAVIFARDKVLISSRPAEKEHGLMWEFPGGKIEKGESACEALRRELQEELGLENIIVLDSLMHISFDYGKKKVSINFLRTLIPSGDLQPREGQQLLWASPAELKNHDLLPADKPLADFLTFF